MTPGELKSTASLLNDLKVKQRNHPVLSVAPLRPEKMIWHGSTGMGQRHVDAFCEGWREQAQSGMASPLHSGSLLQQSFSTCGSTYVVLCIENSYVGQAKR